MVLLWRKYVIPSIACHHDCAFCMVGNNPLLVIASPAFAGRGNLEKIVDYSPNTITASISIGAFLGSCLTATTARAGYGS